jgi:DNA-binding MarR family transcriptional regulator
VTSASTTYGDSLAFLLSQIGAHSAMLFTRRLTELGITPRQFAVLSHIHHDEPRTQQQLADLLGIHRNNMVALIDEMEAAGWVSRHRGDTDRRVFEIRPAQPGTDLVDQVNDLVPDLDHAITAALSNQQRDQLANTLRAITQGLGLTPAIHPHIASRGGSVEITVPRAD